jgi:hypothetical protein
MTQSDLTLPPETRRRKLDDLFSDEPFLSPTMKARRLHEKIGGLPPASEPMQAGSAIPSGEKRLSALIPDAEEGEQPGLRLLRAESPRMGVEAAIRQELDTLADEAPPKLSLFKERATREEKEAFPASGIQKREYGAPDTSESLSLADVAAYLRVESEKRKPESEVERLRRFRKEVLLRWLKDVPKREIKRSGEEF